MPVLERLRCDLTATIKGVKLSRSLLLFAVLTLAFGIGVNGARPRGFSGHSPETVDAWFPIEEAMRGTPGWDNPFRNAVSIVARPCLAAPPS